MAFVGCSPEKIPVRPHTEEARVAGADEGPLPVATGDTVYVKGDGKTAIQCVGDEKSAECGTTVDSAESIFLDCSSSNYSCIASGADVFAVPVGGVRTGETYEYLGSSECKVA